VARRRVARVHAHGVSGARGGEELLGGAGWGVNVLGIDPGKDGGAVILRGREVLASVRVASLIGSAKWHTGGGDAVADWLRAAHAENRIDLAVLELFAGRPMEGRGSAMTTGVGWGIWYGALRGLGIAVLTPTSATWTKALFVGIQGEGKERSVAYCRRFLPDLDLVPKGCRKPQDGLADAGCLAAWGGA